MITKTTYSKLGSDINIVSGKKTLGGTTACWPAEGAPKARPCVPSPGREAAPFPRRRFGDTAERWQQRQRPEDALSARNHRHQQRLSSGHGLPERGEPPLHSGGTTLPSLDDAAMLRATSPRS